MAGIIAKQPADLATRRHLKLALLALSHLLLQ